MSRAATAALLALLAAAPCGAERAAVTLLFDATDPALAGAAPHVAGNWDPETGEPDGGWGGFARHPMHDDGLHGDGAAGDGIWGHRVLLRPSPMHAFEWAVDADADAGNGWIGTGPRFRVEGADPLTIDYAGTSFESAHTLAELGVLAGVSLDAGHAPVPLDGGRSVLFSVRAPEAEAVFLAGSFNAWAGNDDGRITDPRHRMVRKEGGVWVRALELPPGTVRYKFVRRLTGGAFEWAADAHVTGRDGDGNTVLDLRTLMPGRFVTSVPGRPLGGARVPDAVVPAPGAPRLSWCAPAEAWVPPGGVHRVSVATERAPADARLIVRTSTGFGDWSVPQAHLLKDGAAEIPVPAGADSVPIVAEVRLEQDGTVLDREVLVLPVLGNPVDDLRYGFYANYDRVARDYDTKARLLAGLLVNAAEFYDYFPAHGEYAPREEVYELEPFAGRAIHAADIKGKIDAGHGRGILAIAYVAAYAASKSVFDAHPYPMTTEDGDPLHFNGAVKPLSEVRARGEREWFWLMAIAPDSPWHAHILGNLREALTDGPGDFVAFDGFEIDSYGHAESDRYHSEGSAHNGRPLADVIADFVTAVRTMAHEVKPGSAVSFNNVCEFGIDRFHHNTDFLFIENWAGCKPGIEETIDIAWRHRAPTRQRVVLKIYPADAGFTDPPVFPPANLRLMLGMCIAGGGSLMIAGEPDERTGRVHALNTLYYPDNVPLPAENVEIVRAYNRFDALLFGLNHGPAVANHETTLFVPDCAVRAFVNDRGDVTVLFVRTGGLATWNQPVPAMEPLRDQEVAVNIPMGTEIASAWFLSPDEEALQVPLALDFEQVDGHVRTLLPRLPATGALVLKARAPKGK